MQQEKQKGNFDWFSLAKIILSLGSWKAKLEMVLIPSHDLPTDYWISIINTNYISEWYIIKNKWTVISSPILKPRRRQWHPTPVLLPRKSHGRRSLVGCSPWGHEESGTTEWLHFHFSLSCTGEGNGNPLQYSCLESPRDGSLVGYHLWGRTESDTTDVT